MRPEMTVATILRTIESTDRPGTVLRAEVRLRRTGACVEAVLGPGYYRLLGAEKLRPGQDVLVGLTPVPTILGKLEDEVHP